MTTGLAKSKSTVSQKELDEIRAKEKVYQEIANDIQTKVEVHELGNLIVWLTKYKDAFEQQITFHEPFDAFPQDGAVAFYRTLMQKYGFVDHQGLMGFFGRGLPTLMSVAIGPGEVIKVPWGSFALPGFDGLEIIIGTHAVKDGFHFCLSGRVKKKDQHVIQEITESVRQLLKTESIYKSKAISIRFSEDFNPEQFSPDDVAPEFLDLSKVDQSELILPKIVQEMVNDNLFTPVEKTDLCRKFGLPLRRGVLLSGGYGVGKTLTAMIQAQKATRNGWTFIYLKDVRNLADGLRIARQYAPAVVFAEDIDSLMKGEDRTKEMNEVLNTIDGIELKGKEVLTVLTTNHADRINPAMIRPGRIDALIQITPPDADAAARLIHVYGKELIDPKADLTEVGKILAGQRPAMIAEVVQRSRLTAITNSAINEDKLLIRAEDLEIAARSMDHHMKMVDGDPDKKPSTPAENVGNLVMSMAQALADQKATSKNGKQANA